MLAKDKRVLYELDFNARASLKELGKRLRMSKGNLAYNIKRLEKSGIIKSYYMVPDTTKMGLTSYKMMVKYQNITSRIEERMLSELKKAKEVGWIAKCEGAYDLVFICWVKTPFEFERFLTRFMNSYSQYFYLRDIVILTENHACRKSYLVEEDVDKEEVFYKGEPKNICDETDIAIIDALAKNAKESNVDIAEIIGLTPEAVVYRIKQLRKKGIIATFRPRIDLGKLGYRYYNVMFRLRSTSILPQFFAYMGARKSISYYARYLGNYDVGIDIEIESPEKFRGLIDEIRGKFGEHIINYDYILIYEELKITY